MGDGDTGEWVKTLTAARKLGARTICPGHGPMGGPEVLEDQIAFIVELRNAVKKFVEAGAKFEEMKAAAALIKQNLRKNDRIARYIGTSFDSQVEKVYREMSGQGSPTDSAAK
jgi:glyoxylase-like metal-dependent hydrolase (beta-lactamase superfamily II)